MYASSIVIAIGQMLSIGRPIDFSRAPMFSQSVWPSQIADSHDVNILRFVAIIEHPPTTHGVGNPVFHW